MRTLVIKLAGIVDDDSLPRLGELKMSITPVSGQSTQAFFIGANEPITLEITGDGNFTENGTKKLELGVVSNKRVEVSNGTFNLSILNKEAVTRLSFFEDFSHRFNSGLNLSQLRTMRKIYGYCWISTPYQNIGHQIRSILKEFPDAIIIQETFTGAVFQRRIELEKLIRYVKAGDTIVFDSVSRMSSSADEGLRLYEELYNQGVNLVFLKEPHMNTATYRKTLQEKQISLTLYGGDEAADKLMKSIFDAINDYVMSLAKKQIQLAFIQSQEEIEDLHQRAREGMETEHREGKQLGQKQGNRWHIRGGGGQE